MSTAAKNLIIYPLLLLSMFGIMFLLDSAGIHYAPEEHRLNQKPHGEQTEVVDESHSVTEVAEHAETAKGEESELESDDPFFNDQAKKYWVAAIFVISITFAYRTFRNKASA